MTRFCHETAKLQIVAIKRNDTGEWALPGGMVDAGEVVSATVQREFREEAGNVEGELKPKFDRLTESLFRSGKQIYSGYVDDPRNTDNAWLETTAFHFHCSKELGALLPLRAGDDAGEVTWLDVDEVNEPRYRHLYASHKDWVDDVAASFKRRLSDAAQWQAARAKWQRLIAAQPGDAAGPELSDRLHSFKGDSASTLCEDSLQAYGLPQSDGAHAMHSPKHYRMRVDVPADKVPWGSVSKRYSPQDHTDADVLNGRAQGWADGEVDDALRRTLEWRCTYACPRSPGETVRLGESMISFEEGTGRPINPRGRTGVRGQAQRDLLTISNADPIPIPCVRVCSVDASLPAHRASSANGARTSRPIRSSLVRSR